MARVPDLTPGLIVRYGYLWLTEFRQQRTDPSKDRPACVVMQILDEQAPRLEVVGGDTPAPGDVVILPITTRPPEPDALAIELTASEKRVCGLDAAIPSWLILSEFNVDTWPNADLALVPGTNRFDYGVAPPGLMSRISQRFVGAARTRRVIGVRR
jgi:hypothetical protein